MDGLPSALPRLVGVWLGVDNDVVAVRAAGVVERATKGDQSRARRADVELLDGGKDNFAADRAAGDAVAGVYPEMSLWRMSLGGSPRIAGVAPIEVSSGDVQRLRLSRAGDRQLNYALHVMAITPTQRATPGREYYQRTRASACCRSISAS